MMRAIATVLVVFGVLLAPEPVPAAADDGLGYGAAINVAGRQRMLSQRIVKAYCQIGLGILSADSRRQLREAVATFDRQLGDLKAFAPSPEVREALGLVEAYWNKMRPIASGPVTQEGARSLLYLNDDLLHAANRVVVLLQDLSGGGVERLVNISGRQRMLSQRLAKFYMLSAWGFDTAWVRDELETASIEFRGAMEVLLSTRENTEELRQELEMVALQWDWFQHALTLEDRDAYRLIVADASESILRSMEKITHRYEELTRH